MLVYDQTSSKVEQIGSTRVLKIKFCKRTYFQLIEFFGNEYSQANEYHEILIVHRILGTFFRNRIQYDLESSKN